MTSTQSSRPVARTRRAPTRKAGGSRRSGGTPAGAEAYVPPLDKKERHLPGMNYCGPGTNVWRRQRMGVRPVDALDRACLQHDIVTESRGPYESKGKPSALRAADRKLLRRAEYLLRHGYNPAWKARAVADAMRALLLTGARGRKF